MPIYEYQCTKCSERFEVKQAIGEDGSKLKCPKCDAEKPRRVYSAFGTTDTTIHEMQRHWKEVKKRKDWDGL